MGCLTGVAARARPRHSHPFASEVRRPGDGRAEARAGAFESMDHHGGYVLPSAPHFGISEN